MSIKGRTRIAFILTLAVGASGAAAGDDIPRTPGGKPDFSGNYDISTLTPVQRSPGLGDRLTLTPEEAQAIRDREAQNIDARSRASDPNRDAPPLGGSVGGYNYFFMDRGTSAVTVDGKYRTSLLTDPPNGRFPPLTERGKARRQGIYGFSKRNTGPAWWRDREVGPYDHPESLSIADRCVFSLEATIPIYPKNYNNIKTIVQTDTHLMILIEWMHYARVIPISPSREEARHLPSRIRSRAGDSVAWWEGDTLVVDTTNFLEEKWGATTLFGEPSPPADQHVVERFSFQDENTLLYQFKLESGDWETPYGGEYTWPATDAKLYEFACHEGNYATGNTLRGARLEEREVAAQTGG
ncbi:MAG: hypothetical protein OXG81_00195 [Acidobacteria bacterium]|nr:hypothetical protein [Acidobacteriota bacterium]